MSNPQIVSGQKNGVFTAADLARKFGVSRAAVSYALNGRPGISQELREEILASARKHGVPIKHPNLGTDRRLLGLILADIGNPFYSELAVSVSDAARRLGFEVILAHTDDEPRAIQSSVMSMIEHGVSGLIFTVVNANDCSISSAIQRAGIPCVQVSRRSENFGGAFVGINDFAAGYEIMKHLLGHGYRDVCIAAGPRTSSSSVDRARGMAKAAADQGIKIPNSRLIFTKLSVGGGRTVAKYLLNGGKVPQAVACGTDSIAIGLIDAMHKEGIQCPEDIAVVGYDGLLFSRMEMVELTTIVQPREEMAIAAVDLLIKAQSDPTVTSQSVFCNYWLSIGRTCGCSPLSVTQDSDNIHGLNRKHEYTI